MIQFKDKADTAVWLAAEIAAAIERAEEAANKATQPHAALRQT
jgi:hypothetical protein